MQKIYFISGPCGSGKTTFANAFAGHLVRQAHKTVYVIHGDDFHQGFIEPEDKGYFFVGGEAHNRVLWEDILRFNWNFITYIRHERATADQMQSYNDALNGFARKFHTVYVKAEKDRTLRTDIPENKLLASSMHIMLSVAGRYAVGFAYPSSDNDDRTEELIMLKDMILNTYTTKGLKKS